MPHLRPLALLALLALAACGDDVVGPPDPVDPAPTPPVEPTRSEPVTLPVLGQGAITGRYSAELWVHQGTAYTTTWGNRGGNVGNTIYLWDTQGPQPTLVDSLRISGAGTLGDVEVVTRPGASPLMVVATEYQPGSLVIYDLADPRAPRLITRHSTDATLPGVHTAEVEEVGGRLYAFLSVNPNNSSLEPSPARLVIVDITDPAAPREVLNRAMGQPFVHDVFVRDGLLFTANWDEGLVIWDIGAQGGSPANPVRLGAVVTLGGNVHNVWWYHDPQSGSRRYAFVGEEQTPAQGSLGDIHVVDVSDPRNPREVAFFSVAGAGTHNFWVDEARGVLYAAYYNGGVRALDVRGDLGSCTDAQRSDADRGTGTTMLCDLAKMGREAGRGLTDRAVNVWGVQQVGDALYASDMHNGLWKLDLAPLYRALGR